MDVIPLCSVPSPSHSRPPVLACLPVMAIAFAIICTATYWDERNLQHHAAARPTTIRPLQRPMIQRQQLPHTSWTQRTMAIPATHHDHPGHQRSQHQLPPIVPLWLTFTTVAMAIVTFWRHRTQPKEIIMLPLSGEQLKGQGLQTPASSKTRKIESTLAGKQYDILIIGGGPSGLATAYSLASQGYSNIAVLESRHDMDTIDWAKSYSFRVDGHGMKWMYEVGLADAFKKVACKNPDNLTYFLPDGTIKEMVSIGKDIHQETFWTWRNEMVQFLYGQLQERYANQVEIHFSAKLQGIERQYADDGSCTLKATVDEDLVNGPRQTVLTPQFIIGADGVKSAVRRCMEQWDSRFALQHVPHVTSGLRFKALNLLVDEKLAPTGTFFIVRGLDNYAFGVFPQKADRLRFSGCVRLPEDPLWQIKDEESLYNYLRTNWPQIDWPSTLPRETARVFVNSEPVKFPDVVYCPNFQMTMKAPAGSRLGDLGGVMLIGDALHCFAPDLAQGVNAALEDVYAFHKALVQAGDLSATLPLFEEQRSKDVYAIANLLPIGAPYQYTLPFRFSKVVWYLDFAMRLLGSKLLPSFINEPVALGLQKPQYSYSDLLEGYQRTTRFFQITAVAIILGAVVLYEAGAGQAAAWVALAAGVGVAALVVGAMQRGMTAGRAKS